MSVTEPINEQMNEHMKDQPDRLQINAAAHQLSTQLIEHESLIRKLYVALLTGGHVLIEGPPGLAKTRSINLFAASISARFARVQSTPDLLPADITGTDIYQQNSGNFSFIEGPLFKNIVLIDEVNRAPPKVQSAMLEAMGERQITSGGVTRTLAQPFMVAATQNPIEHEGTYPLPEAQKDRFMFFIEVNMPNNETERRILDTVLSESVAQATTPSNTHTQERVDTDTILRAIKAVANIHIGDAVRDYIVRLITATRGEGLGGQAAIDIRQSSSPRGSIFLANAAKANAWLEGRAFATPEDVEAMAIDVLSGRVSLQYRAIAEGLTQRAVISQILQATPKI